MRKEADLKLSFARGIVEGALSSPFERRDIR